MLAVRCARTKRNDKMTQNAPTMEATSEVEPCSEEEKDGEVAGGGPEGKMAGKSCRLQAKFMR